MARMVDCVFCPRLCVPSLPLPCIPVGQRFSTGGDFVPGGGKSLGCRNWRAVLLGSTGERTYLAPNVYSIKLGNPILGGTYAPRHRLWVWPHDLRWPMAWEQM